MKQDQEDKLYKPRKQEEFRAFLRVVRNGNIPPYWQDLAKALGVDPATITAWKKRPEFQKALGKGIQECYSEMKRSGKDDWRQWESRVERLQGEKAAQNSGITGQNIQINVIRSNKEE